MNDNEIEISIGVKLIAGIYFNVDRAEWNAMTDDEKRKTVSDHIDGVSNQMANNAIEIASAKLSGQIVEPGETIDLSEIDIYDPNYLGETPEEDGEFDCTQAVKEGWAIFECGGRWEIQKDDESDIFEDDAAAVEFVHGEAFHDSAYHMQALAWIAVANAE